MRKSGLQKQIAFIFDDVPVPTADSKSMRLPIQQQAESDVDSNPTQPAGGSRPGSADEQQKALSVQQMTTRQTESVHTPAVSALRPKPLPKTQATRPKQKTGQLVFLQVKKALFGASKANMDPRQKKMAIMVGVLSVVFAVVLVVSLGGVGQDATSSAPTNNASGSVVVAPTAQTLEQWQTPQPLPVSLRDPMKPQENQSGQNTNVAGARQMIVKGIVFSQDNPSAIIDGQIIKQGEQVNGVSVVTITKDAVEFEKDGQRWTQQVQK